MKISIRKGVILVVVIGIFFVISILALVAINVMTQQARIGEHKIKRMRAIYAAKAGIIKVYEGLRKGTTSFPTVGSPVTVNLGDINGYTVVVKVVKQGDGANGCPAAVPSDYCLSATAQ